MNEQTVALAAQMYGCRKTVRNVLGEEKFREAVERMRPLLKSTQDKLECSQMTATLELAKAAKPGIETAIVLASCVEIMEPSLPPAA